jgi:hypothetical protein
MRISHVCARVRVLFVRAPIVYFCALIQSEHTESLTLQNDKIVWAFREVFSVHHRVAAHHHARFRFPRHCTMTNLLSVEIQDLHLQKMASRAMSCLARAHVVHDENLQDLRLARRCHRGSPRPSTCKTLCPSPSSTMLAFATCPQLIHSTCHSRAM